MNKLKYLLCLPILFFIIACGADKADKKGPDGYKKYSFKGGLSIWLPIENMAEPQYIAKPSDWELKKRSMMFEIYKEDNPKLKKMETHTFSNKNSPSMFEFDYEYTKADTDIFGDSVSVSEDAIKTKPLNINEKKCLISSGVIGRDQRLDMLECRAKKEKWTIALYSVYVPTSFEHPKMSESQRKVVKAGAKDINEGIDKIVDTIFNSVEIK